MVPHSNGAQRNVCLFSCSDLYFYRFSLLPLQHQAMPLHTLGQEASHLTQCLVKLMNVLEKTKDFDFSQSR